MKFVYIVMSYPADSVYPYSRHATDEAPTNIYAIYSTMREAVATLATIYDEGYMGVRNGTEFGIVKRKIDKRREFGKEVVE